ncbi:ABC transporter permease [Agreia sp. VKM Ac-1783]|uniref:ABC transporter permease n=1 Tax=Agreia sp. VKM Ac-1783 TaxID=1938889 RepID=UPI000A2AC483|nr:ABC transporter permease [Agreia sp. VKM Ac-1783]SMQ62061.1 NitT/TauT family transport system permease protein [Agreia sp. VKM Ac-1783]
MTTTAPPTGPVATNPKIRTMSRASDMPKRRGGRFPSWVPPVIVFIVILAIWYFVSYVLLDPARSFLVPAPHVIIEEAFLDPKVLGDIMGALGRSAGVALTGLAIAIVIGFVWAVAMSQARWIERSLFPYAVILQCIPILALVPLIGFWFGFDFPARVIVCVMISLFPIVSNTLFGLQSVDKGQRELFQLQKASRWTVLQKLEFPAALPAIFAGMRISAGLAVVGAIVGDFFFRRGEPGLGSLISNYQSRVQGPELFAAIIVASLFGVVVFLVFGWLGKLAVGRWYDYSK